MLRRQWSTILLCSAVAACNATQQQADAGLIPADSGSVDAGQSALTDAGPADAGPADAGPSDAGEWDAGTPPTITFTSGERLIIAGGDQPNGVEYEVAHVFEVTRSGHPGSVMVTLTLLTDDNLTQHGNIRLDLVRLSDRTTLPPDDATDCDVPSAGTVIATGAYNRLFLTTGIPAQVRLNFTSSETVTPGEYYAVIFRSEHPSSSRFGLAVTTAQPPAMTDSFRNIATYARAVDRMNGSCGLTSGWQLDPVGILDASFTLDDGCFPGASYSCGRGACARTIPECDAFGNFNQCHPGYCTTDADCVLDWSNPSRGNYGAGTCTNPSGLPYQGLCHRQAEICNGIDDDCNGATDDALGNVTCGTGACQTSVYSCESGVPSDCVASEPAPSPEVCDGVDNDCNGATDDGLPYTAPCGSGPCRRAVYSCILAPSPGRGTPNTCTPDLSQASFEICANGIDDDCNGTTDEGCP
jgi:hypothetical protein